MVKVTDKAKEELKNMLLLHAKDTQACIMLACGSLGQFGLMLGKPKDGDEVIQHKGRGILIIGSEFKSVLDGAILNVEYSNGKREFVMSRK
jgi:hypothetical protein